MENKDKKCSSKEHQDINAICYCKACNVYMCYKCEVFHSKLLQNHNSFKLDNNINEIFTGYCTEAKHKNELEFFCKNHNQLCCAECITKIKGKGKGQHKDCDVCFIEEVKNIKMNSLKKNMESLQRLGDSFQENINKLKEVFEKVNENKENLKLKIQKIFTKIRNSLNEREDKLLLEVDEKFNKDYFNENIMIESKKLPNKIKISLEKGKKLVKEWNNGNNIILLINNCINIENNIKEINLINESIKKSNNSNNVKIVFLPEENKEINRLLDTIKNFGEISFNNQLFYDSLIISNNKIYLDNIINWISPKKNEKNSFIIQQNKRW